MARVNLFDFTSSISNESVSNADDKDVKVNGKDDLPKQVQQDADKVQVDKDVSADASNTKTSEPGPDNGGGDGTATFHTAEKAGTAVKMSDVDPKVSHVQTGGKHVDKLPNQVKAKDNLSASDVSTSVENHDENSDSEKSDLKSIDASGAEVVKEADEMVMDLEGEELEITGLTDAADKGISEADAAIAKSNTLGAAAASVERYVHMLNRLDESGRVLSPELRQSISWALESIDADLFRPERVALESFNPRSRVSLEDADAAKEGDVVDGEDPGEVSKGLGAKLKKIWAGAVRMFWRAVNAVVDAYEGLVGNMPKIRDSLDTLRGQVRNLDGDVDFTMNGAHRLMIGKEFVGDSRNAITRVSNIAQELLMTWPNQVGKVIKEWKEGRPTSIFSYMNGKDPGENLKATVNNVGDMMERAFRGMEKLNPEDEAKVPSGLMNVSRLHWSGPMPGNRALYAGVNDELEATDQANLTKSVSINFSAIPGEDTHAGAIEVTSISGGEAVILIRELEKLTHFIEDAKKGMSEIKKIGQDAFSEGVEDLFNVNGSGEAGARAGLMVMGMVSSTNESQNQFFGYLTAMIKAYMSFISACLKAEGSGSAAIDGESSHVKE